MSGKITPIAMPKWGMEMTEGALAKWHKAEGDAISPGDELADIESEKIVNVYEAETTGVLKRIVAAEGETYPVGRLLAVIADDAVGADEVDAFIASYSGGAGMGAAPAPDAGTNADAPAAGANGAAKPEEASPIAERVAAAEGMSLSGVAGTGRHGRVSLADVESAAGRPVGRKARRVNASPLAKRLAAKRGVDLASLGGSGPRGRILARDVEAARAGGGRVPAAAAGPVSPARSRLVPHSTMRKTIARRLTQSKTTVPHYRLVADFDMGELMRIRAGYNERTGAGASINDFLVKACALALMDAPEANVQFTEEGALYFDQADIAVAMALEGGLVTPVVVGADRKSVGQIAAETKALAEKARAGGLSREELDGGTFSLSNLGMFGVRQFDAVINPPQAAILAVGAVEDRPVGVDGEIRLRPMMTATLSSDHRIIDGAVAAAFLKALRAVIENPVALVL